MANGKAQRSGEKPLPLLSTMTAKISYLPEPPAVRGPPVAAQVEELPVPVPVAGLPVERVPPPEPELLEPEPRALPQAVVQESPVLQALPEP